MKGKEFLGEVLVGALVGVAVLKYAPELPVVGKFTDILYGSLLLGAGFLGRKYNHLFEILGSAGLIDIVVGAFNAFLGGA